MKILINIRSLASKGGAERALLSLAEELVRRGHRVDISVHGRKGKASAYPLPADVGLYCLAEQPTPWHRRPAAALGLGRLRRLQGHVERHGYDLVLGWLRHGGSLVGRLPRTTNAVRVGAMRNLPYTVPPRGSNPVRLIKFYHRRAGFRRADVILVQMPQFRQMLPETWRERCRVIPNAVTMPPEPPLPHFAREKLIVAVSRIVEQKRLDALVRGFALFHRQHPDWKLEIWGQGKPERNKALQTLICNEGVQDSARLMGVTDDIESVYRRARVMAHPSEREGMSNAVAEAMARGLAVVACADCRGMDELICDEETGLLLPGAEGSRPLDRQICEALGRLAADSETSERLGSNARRLVIERFSPQAVYDRWEEELLAAVAGKADDIAPGRAAAE